jgi:hypothetical protein
MRYLLVLGFSCNVYRRDPRARIFLGDKLIDEFYIQNHKDSLNIIVRNLNSNKHILQPFPNMGVEFKNIIVKNFPPLRFYEIEIDKQLKELELRIDIDNRDSNYNNGFMTKSTLLQLEMCYFLPYDKRLLSRLIKIRKKNVTNKNYASYFNRKNIIFRLNENGIEWIGKNTQKLPSNYNIGGDGYFFCRLVKKYGIFISKLSQSYRYRLHGISILEYLIDKYQQHANK